MSHDKNFCFMNWLYIKQVKFTRVWHLLTESGKENIAAKASLDTIALKKAACDVKNIKKAH